MSKTAKVIAITNQKGGVGKTTTSINLAASLARVGKRVLMIDLDPQGNGTVGSGVRKGEYEQSTYDVLVEGVAIKETVINVEAGFDVVPSDGDLAGAQVELLNEIGRELRLKNALGKVLSDYDYIFIDCPPALNVLTINAMVAANSVIIPMQCEYFALEGLSSLVDTIKKIRDTLNPDLQIEGLLRTMFDRRNSLAGEVSDQLETHFGKKVYKTVIPRNVRLAEAPSYGQPALLYDKNSKGALAYLALAAEMVS
ncbi:MAG: ParA family protein [Arenicella sp.]